MAQPLQWISVLTQATRQQWMEWLTGFGVMSVTSLFSPTGWLMSAVMKPYFDLYSLFHSPNFLLSYLHLIDKMRLLGPKVLLGQIFPLLCLCLVAGIAYSILASWLGMRFVRFYIQKNNTQAA